MFISKLPNFAIFVVKGAVTRCNFFPATCLTMSGNRISALRYIMQLAIIMVKNSISTTSVTVWHQIKLLDIRANCKSFLLILIQLQSVARKVTRRYVTRCNVLAMLKGCCNCCRSLATCFATPLRDKLHEKLQRQRVTAPNSRVKITKSEDSRHQVRKFDSEMRITSILGQ